MYSIFCFCFLDLILEFSQSVSLLGLDLLHFFFLLACGLEGIFTYLDYAPNAESEQGVAQAILRGLIDFKRDPWPNISESAKSLVRQMLEPDPKLRLTAKEVLGISLFYDKILPCYKDKIQVKNLQKSCIFYHP